MPPHLRIATRFGVTLCAPGDACVLKKMVCFNALGATRRGRDWKRRHPECVVRTFSLLPGDTSPGDEITVVRRRQRE
jgi:hypothetical protein